jgi:hypothetical protein
MTGLTIPETFLLRADELIEYSLVCLIDTLGLSDGRYRAIFFVDVLI